MSILLSTDYLGCSIFSYHWPGIINMGGGLCYSHWHQHWGILPLSDYQHLGILPPIDQPMIWYSKPVLEHSTSHWPPTMEHCSSIWHHWWSIVPSFDTNGALFLPRTPHLEHSSIHWPPMLRLSFSYSYWQQSWGMLPPTDINDEAFSHTLTQHMSILLFTDCQGCSIFSYHWPGIGNMGP